MVWGYERHRIGWMSVCTRRGAPRAVWCVLAWRPGRNRRGGSVSLFVRHVLVVASRWGGGLVCVCAGPCPRVCVMITLRGVISARLILPS